MDGAKKGKKLPVGRTALHAACEGGHCSTAALLVDQGASKELRDYSGRTPLHVAVVNRHTELVRDLLQHGCDANAADNNGVTALQLAAAQGCRGIVDHLVAAGADVHLQNHVGTSALHAACAADATDIVELLLAHGADPALTDQWSQSPLSVLGAAESPAAPAPQGFRRAARGSFSAILDLLTATAHLDQRSEEGATTPRNEETNPGHSPSASNEGCARYRELCYRAAHAHVEDAPPQPAAPCACANCAAKRANT